MGLLVRALYAVLAFLIVSFLLSMIAVDAHTGYLVAIIVAILVFLGVERL